MKKIKYLTLEEKIKIENKGMVLMPDVLTPEERALIPKMTKEEYDNFDKNIVIPRIKETIKKYNQDNDM